MEPAGESQSSAASASQRRAEIRRRKLLMNSEDRMNRIMGFSGSAREDGSDVDRSMLEPRIHLDVDGSESWSPAVPPRRSPVLPGEDAGDAIEGTDGRDQQRQDEQSCPGPRGLQQYLSRLDQAVKLREQLAAEKQESNVGPEELEPFRIFRLFGSVLLAIAVRLFVCKYLSIFAPFLTLQMAYMGLYKYFPKGERKSKTTVLTAALLLSGIPSEVINRSMDTYRKMGDVFTDLCVYFFTFVVCHELLVLFGSDAP